MLEPLRIFPAYGLDNALLTAVLVGLYVRFFFNEWLGWVFSGLVVPGYLATVILLRPASAVVIILEALLTFMAVRGLSLLLSRTKIGTPMFGRDRFIWIVVASVGIRVFIEGLIVPFVEVRLRTRFGWDLQDSFGLYGIGLVLVPLLANACWKPGLIRGTVQQILCTALTYFLLRGLLYATNLSFANVMESFDRLTLDFTASPKAYLLLVVGALVASRANLRYGWDTSGVVIPGLLCLGWFAPSRILATLAEAMLIALAASFFVRLPRVRDWNIEGPRRIVMLFSIGYFLKLFTVAVFGVALPSFAATELFGIGYLLPSLLAIKIWQRKNPATVLLPAVNLSLVGFGLGSLAGYAALILDASVQARIGAPGLAEKQMVCPQSVSLLSEVRRAPSRVAKTAPSATAPRIAPRELPIWQTMIQRLQKAAAQENITCAQLATELMPQKLGLRLQTTTSPSGRIYYALREVSEEPEAMRGFGLVAVSARPHSGVVLIVERPAKDLLDLSTLVALNELIEADAIVLGGLDQPELGRGDVAHDRDGALKRAVKALGGLPIVVRSGEFAQPAMSAAISGPIAQALFKKLGPVFRLSATSHPLRLDLPQQKEAVLSSAFTPDIGHFSSTASWLAALPVVSPHLSPPPHLPSEDMLLAEQIIRPLARAQASDNLGDLARRIAGTADELKLKVATVEGATPRLALYGHGEGLLLCPGSAEGPLLEVISRRRGVAELAAEIFDSQDAHALLVTVSPPGAEDSGPLGRVAGPIFALTPPLPAVILVRTASAATSQSLIVTDVVNAREPSLALANRLAQTLKSLGISSEMRTQYEKDSIEPPGRLVSLLRVRAGGDFVTLQVSPELRERFRPEPLSVAQLLLFTRLGIAAIRIPLENLLAASCSARPGPSTSDIPEEMLSDARSFALTRHPALITRLSARAKAERLSFSVIDDTRRQESYLAISGKRGAVAIPLRPQNSDTVQISCTQDVTSQIRQAQSRGAAIIAVQAP